MFVEWNNQIRNAQERVRAEKKWEKHLNSLKLEMMEQERTISELRKKLHNEIQEEARLEGISITSLFLMVLGSKDERISYEKQDVALAKLKYDEAVAELQDLGKEYEILRKKVENVTNSEQELKQLIKMKEAYIRENNSGLNLTIFSLDEQMSMHSIKNKELEEAIQAAEKVTISLTRVASTLGEAQEWTDIDMFGGGVVSTTRNHDKIDEANTYMHEAQHYARSLQRELHDIGIDFSDLMDLSTLSKFSDYFFDGLITDWVIQNQINDSLEQVNAYRNGIRSIVKKIKNEKQGVLRQIQELEAQRLHLIEQAV